LRNLEQHATPQIVEERKLVQDRLANVERGWRAVIARINARAGLQNKRPAARHGSYERATIAAAKSAVRR
jgi:hypothetical protein